MKILHTEASQGWGGQEIRILREAEGMRSRGHEIIFATQENSQLHKKAMLSNFVTYQFPITFKHAPMAISRLAWIMHRHKIDIVNTHSSQDAWLGGMTARMMGCPIIRTRHLSTPIRKGLNSKILYNTLADYTVTTCEKVAHTLRIQANLTEERCQSIPTGVDTNTCVHPQEIEEFSKKWNLSKRDFIVGTVCVLRSWKGLSDFLKAAKILEKFSEIKWLIIGSGPVEEKLKEEWQRLKLQKTVFFTGYLTNPFPAIARMDAFALLSTASEGVSQASLQAAFLGKPLITTATGGLPEICVHNETGYQVNVGSPNEVADAVLKLFLESNVREPMGLKAKQLVMEKYDFTHTLDAMENIYERLKR